MNTMITAITTEIEMFSVKYVITMIIKIKKKLNLVLRRAHMDIVGIVYQVSSRTGQVLYLPTPLAGGQRKIICGANEFYWPPARGVGI